MMNSVQSILTAVMLGSLGLTKAAPVPPVDYDFKVDLYNPCSGNQQITAPGTTSTSSPEVATSSPGEKKAFLSDMLLTLSTAKLDASYMKGLIASRLPHNILTVLEMYTGYPGIPLLPQSGPLHPDEDVQTHLKLLALNTAYYAVRVHQVKMWEVEYAEFELRPTTYETEMTSYEQNRLSAAMCAHKLILGHYGVALDSEVVGQAETYSPGDQESHFMKDVDAFILFNSLEKDFGVQINYIYDLMNSL